MRIGILNIATGKYKNFLEPLFISMKKNFLVEHDKTHIIFTDDPTSIEEMTQRIECKSLVIRIERKGFPGDTLYRYHHFYGAVEQLRSLGDQCPEALYYIDADMLVRSKVGDEVLPTQLKSLIATSHPGYHGISLGTPETNQNSKAFIPNDRYRPCYWAGGFNGGEFQSFMDLSAEISKRIDEDDKRGIVAVWHDESHLNAYLSERGVLDKVKTLTPAFCYPEEKKLPFEKKIVALCKNHVEVRSV